MENNRIDWKQLYETCISNMFTEQQVQVIKSLLKKTFERVGLEGCGIVYRDLYKSFSHLLEVSNDLYKDVVDNINTCYYHSDKLRNSMTVKTVDSLYGHYFNCQQLVNDFLTSIKIELTDEQDAKLHKLLSESIFFYYVLEKEFFEKDLEMKDIVCLMEDKANIGKLQKTNICTIKFLGNRKNDNVSFTSKVIVEELKDICTTYLSRRLAVNQFDSNTWSELAKENKFWKENEQYNRRHLFNSFLRSVIQAFIDCDVKVKEATINTIFDLEKVDKEGDMHPVQLTKELASYAYDLLGKVMFSAVKGNDSNHIKSERREYELSLDNSVCRSKVDFVKSRLKGNNDGYVKVVQDGYNGFKIVIMNNSKMIREFPFSLLF